MGDIFLECCIVVIGRSTHNQRIERLWRDVYGDCLSLFYQIFQYLEMHNMLDADDETHIWCLHMVYLPMINQHLETWKASWVHHPLRTESNKSPMQLWISRLHATQFGLAMLRNARDPVTEVNIVSLSQNIFFQFTIMCKKILNIVSNDNNNNSNIIFVTPN